MQLLQMFGGPQPPEAPDIKSDAINPRSDKKRPVGIKVSLDSSEVCFT